MSQQSDDESHETVNEHDDGDGGIGAAAIPDSESYETEGNRDEFAEDDENDGEAELEAAAVKLLETCELCQWNHDLSDLID
jgi:hypothetical protein